MHLAMSASYTMDPPLTMGASYTVDPPIAFSLFEGIVAEGDPARFRSFDVESADVSLSSSSSLLLLLPLPSLPLSEDDPSSSSSLEEESLSLSFPPCSFRRSRPVEFPASTPMADVVDTLLEISDFDDAFEDVLVRPLSDEAYFTVCAVACL